MIDQKIDDVGGFHFGAEPTSRAGQVQSFFADRSRLRLGHRNPACCPAFIITEPTGYGRNERIIWVDRALARGYLMMSSASRGLGTCRGNHGTQIGDPELPDALEIPVDCTIVATIALGYPV